MTVENLIQIESGTTINTNVNVKIQDDSAVTCDEIIDTTKTVPTKSTSTSSYILLAFFLITIVLLVAVKAYAYLIKYKVKQKHLLPYYVTTDRLQEVYY